MTRPVVYIAHQLSGDIEANRAAASQWVAWAAKVGLAPVATWIVLSGEWTEEEGRDLGLEVDCALVRRCDALLLCGPRISDGMRIEAREAYRNYLDVIDLTGKTFEHANSALWRWGWVK